jgi:hypothetical protein
MPMTAMATALAEPAPEAERQATSGARLARRKSVRVALREHAFFLGGLAAYWLIALAAGARALAAPATAVLAGVLIWGVLAVVGLLATIVTRAVPTPGAALLTLAGWFRHRTRDPGEALRIVLAASGICFLLLTPVRSAA